MGLGGKRAVRDYLGGLDYRAGLTELFCVELSDLTRNTILSRRSIPRFLGFA